MKPISPNPPNTPVVAVAGCFLLSGFAALLYQMAWMRQFSTVFGTSELAVATVLSAYMGGLALGLGIDCPVRAPRAREWKGSVPKSKHQPRILTRLEFFETAIVENVMPKGLRHNAIDAVGLALWACGRMRPATQKQRYRR